MWGWIWRNFLNTGWCRSRYTSAFILYIREKSVYLKTFWPEATHIISIPFLIKIILLIYCLWAPENTRHNLFGFLFSANRVIGPGKVGCRPEIIYGHVFCHIKAIFAVNVTTFAPNWAYKHNISWPLICYLLQTRSLYHCICIIFMSLKSFVCKN